MYRNLCRSANFVQDDPCKHAGWLPNAGEASSRCHGIHYFCQKRRREVSAVLRVRERSLRGFGSGALASDGRHDCVACCCEDAPVSWKRVLSERVVPGAIGGPRKEREPARGEAWGNWKRVPGSKSAAPQVINFIHLESFRLPQGDDLEEFRQRICHGNWSNSSSRESQPRSRNGVNLQALPKWNCLSVKRAMLAVGRFLRQAWAVTTFVWLFREMICYSSFQETGVRVPVASA
mmetsp:Transcript_52039/g.106079  ORF Transcript_52039/g.106079 Transcript_52039/m.106079 type:complete len:234 (-) Transcript_52039:463-1164(-)